MTVATEKFVARHLEPGRVSRGGGGARGGAGARAAQDQNQQGGSLLYLDISIFVFRYLYSYCVQLGQASVNPPDLCLK